MDRRRIGQILAGTIRIFSIQRGGPATGQNREVILAVDQGHLCRQCVLSSMHVR
jgi:hypothetical protein